MQKNAIPPLPQDKEGSKSGRDDVYSGEDIDSPSSRVLRLGEAEAAETHGMRQN